MEQRAGPDFGESTLTRQQQWRDYYIQGDPGKLDCLTFTHWGRDNDKITILKEIQVN